MNGHGNSDFADSVDPPGAGREPPRPVPGNHEYVSTLDRCSTSRISVPAPHARRRLDSYDAGQWLVLAINSNVPAGDGLSQVAWLRGVLAASKHKCTLAYWHHPRFSSSRGGDNGHMRTIWQILDQAGADVVLSGHDHVYERMAPQDADGRYAADGIREFIVGTGGAYLYDFPAVKANSEVRGAAHGVMKLTLRLEGYDWDFLPTAAYAFHDAGSGQCY